jgi:RNA polymerase sigma-70 factor (ECF subfamily)
MATTLTLQLPGYGLERSPAKSSEAPACEPGRPELASCEILSRIAGGDQQALAALYDRANRVIFGMAYRILQNDAEAEEAMLDIFMCVWRKAGDFDPSRGTPTAWLLMMARSRVIDWVRSNKIRRDREEPLDEIEFFADGNNPEEHSANQQLGSRLRDAMTQLSWEQRQVIEMAFFQGFSHSEIASKLRTPLGTIKTRIRTGMRQLRQRVEALQLSHP